MFVAFDRLHLQGQDLRPRPLSDRRRTLKDVIEGQEFLHVVRRLADHGFKAWDQVQERGYEDLVAKNPRLPYDAQRARRLKVKPRHEGRFVLGGVIHREDLNALLVGARRGGRFHFVGIVDFGVGRRLVATLLEHAPARDSSPFADVARWNSATSFVPVRQVEVTYAEMMQGRLRDPVFRGFTSG